MLYTHITHHTLSDITFSGTMLYNHHHSTQCCPRQTNNLMHPLKHHTIHTPNQCNLLKPDIVTVLFQINHADPTKSTHPTENKQQNCTQRTPSPLQPNFKKSHPHKTHKTATNTQGPGYQNPPPNTIHTHTMMSYHHTPHNPASGIQKPHSSTRLTHALLKNNQLKNHSKKSRLQHF